MRISDWSSDVCSSDLLEVHDVADHVELVGDPVAAMHVAGLAGEVEGLAAGVALAERDRLGRRLAGVQQAAELQAGLQADGHLGLHVGELLLAERSAEHTSELPSLMRPSYAVLCLHKHTTITRNPAA